MPNNITGQVVVRNDELEHTFILGEEVKIQTSQNETLCGILVTVFENSLKLKRKSGSSENIDFSDIIDIWR